MSADRLELGDETPTTMCARCATHVPSEVPTVNDGHVDVDYCPVCGFEIAQDLTAERVAEYFGDDAPQTDLAELAAIVRQTTAARGLDVYATEVRGASAAEWAEMTGRDRSTVSRNIRRATSEE